MYGEDLTFQTPGKGLHEITEPLRECIRRADVESGLCSVFILHTSASLLITENADPSVKDDLMRWFDKVAPENDPEYTHTSEGPDDMPSHLKAAITRSSEQLPVKDGRLALGTWQGVFIFEHRTKPHQRTVSVRVWD
ncbi:MAG: YjbQ family protein [Planctomycetia bacterium]|jgi:secondary thiamine-phosphate synthase enzyme|nr:YjbQ family protein [Planctomycetia bacterium]NCF97962.1 YjbQ family protein [Planctomycetia bacterium]NCG12656.1 YjbQ family protein [Planctomycetia bacterium]